MFEAGGACGNWFAEGRHEAVCLSRDWEIGIVYPRRKCAGLYLYLLVV